MECPHCQMELPALECASCGQKALEGAAFCHHCGHQLEAGAPAPAQLTCATCGQKLLAAANHCHNCGHEVADAAAADLEMGQRVACPDGACIGIIGPDGRCTECGQTPGGPPSEEEN